MTDLVSPTCVESDESANNLINKVSSPSLMRSFERVCEKEKAPLLLTKPEPVKEPLEKSELVIPVPLSE